MQKPQFYHNNGRFEQYETAVGIELLTVSANYELRITNSELNLQTRIYTRRQLEKELSRQAALFEEACKSGQITNGGNIKLVDFIPQYYENIRNSVTETTFKKYHYVIEAFVIPSLGHMKLIDIKPIHIQRFVNELANCDAIQQKKKPTTGTGRKNKKPVEVKEPRKLSASSVQRYYTCLRSVMHNAYSLDLIPYNPCDKAKIKLPHLGEEKTEIFDKQELADMVKALETEPLQFKTLIHLAISTGCRRGEIVALEWSDIDFENKKVFVHKSAYKLTGEPIKIGDTKTHKSRTVDIPDYMVDLLARHRAEQLQRRLKIGTAWNGDDWIFTQDDGSIMFPTTPTQNFSKFLKRKGLPHRKFHALRHTSATMQLILGTDIKTVGERLGHSQMKTTNRYVHAVEETNRKAADALGDLITSFREQPKGETPDTKKGA